MYGKCKENTHTAKLVGDERVKNYCVCLSKTNSYGNTPIQCWEKVNKFVAQTKSNAPVNM